MTNNKKSANLWAPWRMDYILGEKEKGCIFCNKINENEKNDKFNLILFRGEYNFVIMNKYPYNNGHLMIVPYRHTAEIETLDGNENMEMMEMVSKSIKVLKESIHPEGFNIGMNIGNIAGAGIDDHLHFHIVPRWNADTNFMPVVGHTKVISEALSDTWDKLKVKFLAE